MSIVLTLPRLGETMEEGHIVAWLVSPGQAYRRGDPLLEVETDKTVVEVPALEDGELVEILAPEGAQVSVGDPVARLSGEPAAETVTDTAPQVAAVPDPTSLPHTQAPARSRANPGTTGLRATPVARRLARHAGLDISTISGTGRRNRVEKVDVLRQIEGASELPEGGESSRLAYALTGPETGRPVVLLHGFGGDHTVWAGVQADLNRTGFRVLAPDLPGHGGTRATAATPEDLSDGLAELLTATLGGSAHLVAHSLGAVPAVALADAGAAQSLALIAPVGLGLGIDATFLRGLASARSAGEVAHLLQRMSDEPLLLSADALDQIAASMAQGRLTELAESLVGAAGQTLSLRAPLARLAEKIPVRILVPHRDRILDWSDMVTVSPRIAVHHLPCSGHMAAWDARSDVRDILRAAIGG